MSQAFADAFAEVFRCLPGAARFRRSGEPAAGEGFFRFGGEDGGGDEPAIAFGRMDAGNASAVGYEALQAGAELPRTEARRCADGAWLLPFDPDEIADNFRRERWSPATIRDDETKGAPSLTDRAGSPSPLRKAYYAVRPLLPVVLRRPLQRFWMRDWRKGVFPRWPLDLSLDQTMDALMRLAIRDAGGPVPFIWFWPDGQDACLLLTHDAETAAGRDFCGTLMDLDMRHGLRGSVEVIPERRYEVPEEFLRSIRDRGFELNVHGLYHDGRLFDDRAEFLRRVERINDYARRWGARGFRSPVGYRRLDWFDRLTAFDYDMSVPAVGRLEAQRGGCCSARPYFLGHLVELPLTTTQDYTLIHILKERSIDLWRRQIEEIVPRHGLLSFVIHPDYVRGAAGRRLLDPLLAELQALRDRVRIWNPLPGEAAAWWRARARMRLVSRDGRWVVEGAGAERACVGLAAIEDGRVVYRVA